MKLGNRSVNEKDTLETLLEKHARPRNFLVLRGITKVECDDIHVDNSRFPCQDYFFSLREIENAINQSQYVIEQSVPSVLVQIIAGYSYNIRCWIHLLRKQYIEDPKIRRNSISVSLDEFTTEDYMRCWFPLSRPARDRRREFQMTHPDDMEIMRSTIKNVIETLKQKCCKTKMFYQVIKRDIDFPQVYCIIITGISQKALNKYIYSFRVKITPTSID